jgi:hypothetical protein
VLKPSGELEIRCVAEVLKEGEGKWVALYDA